jgi:hypothetical protein
MNVNDLESRMWDYQFQIKGEKTSLSPKTTRPNQGAKL